MTAIGDSFIAKLVEEAYELMKDEVVLLSGAASQIELLEDTFRSIQLILPDANQRRIQDGAVNKWFIDLKDVMYDADDVLDECRIKAEKHKLHSSVTLLSRFSPRPYFHKITWGYQIKRRIENINARLTKITSEISQFGFITNFRPSHPEISRKTSHLADLDIVGSGIEEDRNNLVNLLTGNGHQQSHCVCAIVGMGGIGKTTLARKIYNDVNITAFFGIKLWVSVTQDFTDMDLLHSIATQLSDQYPSYRRYTKSDSRDCIEPLINWMVRQKRFLIVLDDIWSERVWYDLLQRPLQGGNPGSQVLITTRKLGVAESVGAIHIHNVQPMSPEDGWALLRKMVTLNVGEEDQVEGLEDLGLEIVEKCGGLPLAMKAIGGTLRNKPKRRKDWEVVLNNSNWSVTELPEGVHVALYLSYEDLPSHLKDCFLYVCLFPLEPYFGKRSLITYWIAERFIKGQVGWELEELGEEYYLDLLQRGLLQPDPNSYEYNTCIVHELFQSLAQFLAQGESLVQMQYKSWRNGDTCERSSIPIAIKPRRLSTRVSEGETKAMLDFAQKNTYLRTLLLRSSKMSDQDLKYLVNTATRLRVLDLRWSKINKLPKSISVMIHLRSLILTNTTITEIPESIGDLLSLQSLYIQGCKNLRSIPKGITRLIKLRSLDIYDNRIEGIPQGINQLKYLNVLQGFVINSDSSGDTSSNNQSELNALGNWSTLKEVRGLTNLRRLTIHKLDRVRGVIIRESVLRDMSRLEFLELSSDLHNHVNYPDEDKNIEEIFEVMLLPPYGIEILKINGFFGKKLPSWLATFLHQLRRLELKLCNQLEQLPPLGMLPSLDYLEVSGVPIKTIGNEFFGQFSCNPFPMLTTLIFTSMYMWEEWKWDIGANIAFARLQSLELDHCALRSIPVQLCCGDVPLKKLDINYVII